MQNYNYQLCIRQPVEYINSNNAFSIGVRQDSRNSSISCSERNFGIRFPSLGPLILVAGFFRIIPSP